MSYRVNWYKRGQIVVFEVGDPLTLADIEAGAEDVWALVMEVREPVDMIFDYTRVKSFPRGALPIVRNGHFMLPTLDRVALVGNEPLVEMMMVTITRDTYRPNPTIHTTVQDAAEYLMAMAAENR